MERRPSLALPFRFSAGRVPVCPVPGGARKDGSQAGGPAEDRPRKPAYVKNSRQTRVGGGGGEIRHQIQLERWPRAGDLFLELSPRSLPLRTLPGRNSS